MKPKARRKLQIAGRRRESPRTHAVALRRASRGAFEGASADKRGRFRVDQVLIQRLGRDPGPIADIGEFQFPE